MEKKGFPSPALKNASEDTRVSMQKATLCISNTNKVA